MLYSFRYQLCHYQCPCLYSGQCWTPFHSSLSSVFSPTVIYTSASDFNLQKCLLFLSFLLLFLPATLILKNVFSFSHLLLIILLPISSSNLVTILSQLTDEQKSLKNITAVNLRKESLPTRYSVIIIKQQKRFMP